MVSPFSRRDGPPAWEMIRKPSYYSAVNSLLQGTHPVAEADEAVLVADSGRLGQHAPHRGSVGGQEMNGVVVEAVGDPQRRADPAGELQATAVPPLGVVRAVG